MTREVVDGLLAYDRACREGDRAAVEFLGLLDAHDATRRGLDGTAATAKCPVAQLEDYPEWQEMSGRLSANGTLLLAKLGARAGEAGSTIFERLGLLADLLAVDDAILDFDTLRREVVARAASDGTIPFYAEGHGDLVKRATTLAELSPLPAWALAAAREVLAHAEACQERKADIIALHASAAGLLDERTKLEDRARTADGSEFTPPTKLEGYADWLAHCGEASKGWRAMRKDADTWKPHLDRLKDEAGKIAAAVKGFDQLGDHDLAWARVFQERLTMAEREKAGGIISFYQQGWEELVEEARAFGRQQGLPEQARGLVERVLGYDRRLGRERATVVGFFKDAEDHRQRRDPLEEEVKRRARQDPDFLVTDLPGYRSLPDIPKKLLTAGRAIHKDEDTYAPHLDRIPDGKETLAAALERIERYHLLDRFVSVMDRIEETKTSAVTQGISPVGDEGYDEAIEEAARLAREPDLEEAARRRLQAEIDEHASLAIEWREIEHLFREAAELNTQYLQLEERAAREGVPRSLLAEWPALQERSHRFEEDARWVMMGDRIQEYRQLRPDTFRDIEEALQLARERRSVPELEEGWIAAMVSAELARLRDPGAEHAFDRPWWSAEPLLAGDRIRLQLRDDGPQLEAVVRRPGWTGGCTRHDMVELEWVAAPQGRKPDESVAQLTGLRLAGCGVHRAEWSDERLREVERARQFPAPPAAFPFSSAKDITKGDVLYRSEVAGPDPAAPESPRLGRPAVVRIEMEVVDRTAATTEEEDRCTLRELWRSDNEPFREFSLSLDLLAEFARGRAFWDSEDERWSRAHARKMELDERRVILNLPGPHYVMRP